jgi:ADP-ribose pyrophosphatase
VAGGFRAEGERALYEGRTISLALGSFRSPTGERFEREVVHHPGAVSVVPLLPDGQVVLVRQYRAPVDRELLELPAGKRDVEGEPPEVTANRELAEEVGLRAGRLELLAEFHNSPGFCDEHSFVFLGRELADAPRQLHGVEEQHLRVERYPLGEVAGMIERGEITDAKTIIGLLLTLRRVGG